MSWMFGRVEHPSFHDKLWKRADMVAWDERWARLSLPARRQYLDKVKAATHPGSQKPLNKTESFDLDVIRQWRDAGLIRDEVKPRSQGFVVTDEALGFTTRLRALQRFHLLDPANPGDFLVYLNQCFATYLAAQVCDRIVREQTGISRYDFTNDVFHSFVQRRRWPDWVAAFLKDPLAGSVVAAIEAHGVVVPLARLHEYLPGRLPLAIRQTVDRLLSHLALFEDLDPKTLDILVGLLPAVIQDRQRASEKPVDQPLRPAQPVDTAPQEGMYVADLRSVLLEMAGQPPRIKQNSTLFQKEEERFLATLEPFPNWLLGKDEERISDFPRIRVEKTLALARQMELAREVRGANSSSLLELTEEGQRWLALPREEQYAWVYSFYRDPKTGDRFTFKDAFFLGSNITAVPGTHEPNPNRHILPHQFGRLLPEDRLPLREAIYRTFAELPVGTFVSAQEFLTRFATGKRNPLLLGRDAASVVVHREDRRVLPLEEHLEEVARRVLWLLMVNRLIGLGCIQVARDAGKQFLFARLPRLDVYFGKLEVAPATADQETRVVVQPDFSVILIGLNPAPAAELAPFCERVRGRSSQGSLTFRLTRESVVKGLMAGLPPEQVMARLEKYASTPIPKNVATEVRGWCGWARKVSPAPAMLIRCPDMETADRVMAALGKQGERIADTVVALAVNGLTGALRQKLARQGIMLEDRKKRG
jgi:hypothetical protein